MRNSLLVLILFSTSLRSFGQRDHGSVGRAGGDRVTHEARQTAALEKNNDPRFVPYRSLITKELKQSIDSVVRSFDRDIGRGLKLSPEEYLSVQLLARKAGIDPEILAVRVAPPLIKTNSFKLTHEAPTFHERLSEALTRLSIASPSSAMEDAGKAIAEVSASRAPIKF